MASLPKLPSAALLTTPVSSEPSEQWAADTLDAVSEEQSRIHELPPSNVSTPGLSIPGAFPRPAGTSTIQADVGYVKDAALSAFETAKGYMGAAGETVGQYVPPSVSAYLPSRSKDPQDEVSVNGLGAVSGESLAKLPEERLQEGLPSHDDESSARLGWTSGAGPLPGSSSETGVAILPEEKNNRNHSSSTEATSNVFSGIFGPPSAQSPGEGDDEFPMPLGLTGPLPMKGLGAEYGQTYLNPKLTQETEPTPTVTLATALPPRIVPEDPNQVLTHRDQVPRINSSVPSTTTTTTTTAQCADTDASTQSLAGSRLFDALTPPTPPPKPTKNELETFREHDTITPSTARVSDVFITSAKEHHRQTEKADKTKKASTHEPTVSRSAGEGPDRDLQNTSANKPLNTSPRTHPLANAPATFNNIPLSESFQKTLDSNEDKQLSLGQPDHGKLVGASVPNKDRGTELEINSPRGEAPVVPEKIETKKMHSSTATAGHAHGHGAGGGAGIPVPGTAALAAGIGGHTGRASEDSGSGERASPTKKAGFMAKVKGEMKVLSGKLGHNEEKIEEGRRMMGKN